MKNIILLISIVSTCARSQITDNHKFLLNIWDYDFSMAYTIHYKINNDSITVVAISGMQGENNKVLLNRVISQKEEKKIYTFLSSFPIDSIATEYKNPLINDGDQKRIEIVFNNKKKSIDVANFYQKDIACLFNTINQFLSNDIKIKYSK